MQNSNDNRYFKKDGKTVNKKYIAKKHSKEKHKKLFDRLYILLLVILAIATIVITAYTHSYMKISQIFINGNHQVSDTDIISKLGNPIGKNIISYNPYQYEASIKEIPQIDDVKVSKVFPNLINVKITETYPVFVQEVKGTNYYISNRATLMNIADEDIREDEKIIELKGVSLRDKPGEIFTRSDATVKFIAGIQKYQYFDELKQLNLENKGDIGIMLNDIDVKFGDLNNIDYKLKLLDSVLDDIHNKSLQVTEINLKDIENPVVKVNNESFSENLNY